LGLLFTAGSGASSYVYNLFYEAPLYVLSANNPSVGYGPGETGASMAVWAVPEPATWLMTGLGAPRPGRAKRRSREAKDRAGREGGPPRGGPFFRRR
jgi:hypothetical protein